MASETLILRPVSVGTIMGTPSRYPSDTSDANLHILVSEETADDDSTYIAMPSMLYFNFTLPDEYIDKTPYSIGIYFRAANKSTDATINTTVYITIPDSESETGYASAVLADNIELTSSYQTFRQEISTEYISHFYSVLTDKDSIANFAGARGHVLFDCTDTSNTKSSDTRLTQIYLELIYNDSETTHTDIIYVKQNGNWVAIDSTFYQKQNGAWVLTDSSVLQNGFQYVFNDGSNE